MKKNYQFKLVLAVLSIVLLHSDTFAFSRRRSTEATPTASRTYVPPAIQITAPSQSTSAPFDGGLSILIAAGVGYASKKAYDKRKKQKEALNGKS